MPSPIGVRAEISTDPDSRNGFLTATWRMSPEKTWDLKGVLYRAIQGLGLRPCPNA